MHSISRSIEIETLKRAGVALVVIGNGSPAMIKSYRRKSPEFIHSLRY